MSKERHYWKLSESVKDAKESTRRLSRHDLAQPGDDGGHAKPRRGRQPQVIRKIIEPHLEGD